MIVANNEGGRVGADAIAEHFAYSDQRCVQRAVVDNDWLANDAVTRVQEQNAQMLLILVHEQRTKNGRRVSGRIDLHVLVLGRQQPTADLERGFEPDGRAWTYALHLGKVSDRCAGDLVQRTEHGE